jgi:hypothetical protein
MEIQKDKTIKKQKGMTDRNEARHKNTDRKIFHHPDRQKTQIRKDINAERLNANTKRQKDKKHKDTNKERQKDKHKDGEMERQQDGETCRSHYFAMRVSFYRISN